MKRIVCLLILVSIFTASSAFAKSVTFAVLSDVHYSVNGEDRPMKMLDMPKKQDWREHFGSDNELTDMFR